jgi:hypothetical protein
MKTAREFIVVDGITVCREIDDIDIEAEKLGKHIGNRNYSRTRQAIDYNEYELSKIFMPNQG